MMNGIPPALAQLLQASQAPNVGTDPRAALLQAIQNAMGQQLKTPSPDLAMPASLTQGMREDDPRRYYPPITPESMATDTPPPAPTSGQKQISVDETSYEARPGPGEDQAAAMAARAVEGKGVKYPSTPNDESDANDTVVDTQGRFPAYRDVPSSGNVDPAEAAVASKLEQGGDQGTYTKAELDEIMALVQDNDKKGLEDKYGMSINDAQSLLDATER